MQELCGTVSGPGVARVWLLVLCCLALPGPHVAELDPTTPPGLQATLAAQKSLFSSLHDLTKMGEVIWTAPMVMERFVVLPTFIADVLNLPPLLSFIASSPAETDPSMDDVREIVAKIDAILEELDSLKTMWNRDFWNKYDVLCSNHESNIRKSWKFLKDFLIRGPTAKTMEGKSRLAGKFTSFFAQSQTESSVTKLHEYVDENIMSYETLLKSFSDAINGDFYRVGHFCSYLGGLLVLGQQMKVYYHLLAESTGAASAEEAMKSLSDLFFASQEVLSTTIERFMHTVKLDVYRMANAITAGSRPTQTASNVAKYMNEKYNWLLWTAVAVESKSEPEEAFDMRYRISSNFWLCINHAPLANSVIALSCSAEECIAPAGTCKNWQAVGVNFCKCAKNFYGPNCSRNVKQDIEESRLMSWDHPIIVPDLTSIYYSIMDLKNLLKKSQ